jgi:tRNA (guanine37-N1)-methyltransferase
MQSTAARPQVYWSSRLHSEHERVARSFGAGSLVWDLFAGAGPFATLAARRGDVTVLANDLNPAACEALLDNAALNGVSARLLVYGLGGRF